MPIHVTSETGPLKKVLLHRPGLELEHLTPTSLEQLLFDDIPYLAAAQREHDAFAQALTDNGVEVVYLEKLMAETISNRPELRKAFIGEFPWRPPGRKLPRSAFQIPFKYTGRS